MPQPHWKTDNGDHGCQATECTNKATWQWQRHMTTTEIDDHLTTLQNGPYGQRHTSPPPYNTATYACDQHTPKTNTKHHNHDLMAKTHKENCPLPDPGCEC